MAKATKKSPSKARKSDTASSPKPVSQIGSKGRSRRDEIPKSLVDAQKRMRSKLATLENSMCPEPVFTSDVLVKHESFVVLGSELSGLTAYAGHLNQAIQESDVIVEVLDARDPLAFRCEDLERRCLEQGKKVVLLLNKIDLLDDMKIVEDWEKYLRKYLPTITFRAMTTPSRTKASTCKFSPQKATEAPVKVLQSGYDPLGAGSLMGLLRNYSRTTHELAEVASENMDLDGDLKVGGLKSNFKAITVCIVGMPNVGKSSVINSLCRNTMRVKTGNEAGVTRNLTHVKLSEHIKLIDTPGVVLDKCSGPSAVLHGWVKKYSDCQAELALEELVRQYPPVVDQWKRLYNLSDIYKFTDIRQFLAEVSERRKLLKAGGYRNIDAAMKLVIEDWRNAKIKFHTVAPVEDNLVSELDRPAKQWVTEPSAALDLDLLSSMRPGAFRSVNHPR